MALCLQSQNIQPNSVEQQSSVLSTESTWRQSPETKQLSGGQDTGQAIIEQWPSDSLQRNLPQLPQYPVADVPVAACRSRHQPCSLLIACLSSTIRNISQVGDARLNARYWEARSDLTPSNRCGTIKLIVPHLSLGGILMLIDRERELDELNAVLSAPSARLLAVSGRRRLGKTTLLVHWAQTSQHPYLYWVSSRLPSSLLLQQFSQRVWQHGHPDERVPRTFSYEGWSEVLEELARMCQNGQRHIVIIDEFPYAVASEPGLPSILQNTWDHHLKSSNVCMVLCGSHVGMMESLLNADAPLYGRMVGPLRVRPLPFSATAAFFPSYSIEQRIAVYAILGGVPAYLELFSE